MVALYLVVVVVGCWVCIGWFVVTYLRETEFGQRTDRPDTTEDPLAARTSSSSSASGSAPPVPEDRPVAEPQGP